MDYTIYEFLTLDDRTLYDLELIMNGGFYPLSGFMSQNEYQSVLDNMTLLDGSFFPLPINLSIDNKMKEKIQDNNYKYITLKDQFGFPIAIMQIIDIYKPNLEEECMKAYNTIDLNHPYVKIVMDRKNLYYIGGKIVQHIQLPKHFDFNNLRLTPQQTKQYFKDHQWDIVIGFQTRNPMHKAHYEITKYALAQIPNSKLLLHPSVGVTQIDDINYYTRVKCYKEIIKYYSDDSVLLSLLPLSMRMAGPRETLLHAIIRKNYGCTHFIVGRDHAGPSSKNKYNKPFYGAYDAQNLAKKYENDLGIKIVFVENMVYVKELNTYLPEKNVNSSLTVLNLSGSEQRNLLKLRKELPDWLTFKEVNTILQNDIVPKNKEGLCCYFIGLSGAGKTTIAMALINKLKELYNRKISYLDADIIRTNLSKGLGFSKEDRSTNVRRIGFVAAEIVKHQGIVVIANIAPYEEDRQYNKDYISQYGNYYEIFVDTPLIECEKRDCKGLYKMARCGKIQNFTGVSDPFEIPKNPSILVNGTDDIDFIINKIVTRLQEDNVI